MEEGVLILPYRFSPVLARFFPTGQFKSDKEVREKQQCGNRVKGEIASAKLELMKVPEPRLNRNQGGQICQFTCLGNSPAHVHSGRAGGFPLPFLLSPWQARMRNH